MRAGSTSKKRQQFDRYVQSRVLITSNSINPLSQHISTKLDLIKKQISRQFHEKFPTEKKRNSSLKKSNSSSKSKLSQQKITENVNRKLNFDEQKPHQYSQSSQLGRNIINIVTEQNTENQNYKEKYYELQDKFLEERKKMLEDFQKSSNFKQKVIQFLEEFTEKGAEQLKQYYTSDRQKKVIEKCFSLNEYLSCAEKTISQILAITEVQDIQQLLEELKNRQNNYKNLGQYSFKILELQTAYNKLQKECAQKLEEGKSQNQERENILQSELKKQIEMMDNIIQRVKNEKENEFKRMLNKIIIKINKIIKHSGFDSSLDGKSIKFVTFDKDSMKRSRTKNRSELLSRENSRTERIKTSPKAHQIREESTEKMIELILQMFQQMEDSVTGIETEAENNMEQLMVAEQSLEELRKKVQQLTEDFEEEKNKLIEHFEMLIDEKQIQLNKQGEHWHKNNLQKQESFKKLQTQLNGLINKLDEQNSKIQGYIRQKEADEQKLGRKQQIINKIVKIICETTGEDLAIFGIKSRSNELQFQSLVNFEQSIITKIEVILKKHLESLKDNLQAAENLILWHQKQLEIKQALLKEFDFNLKRLIEDSEQSQSKQKQMAFQRDQYKYLLNNLRESIIELKKDHEMQVQKIRKEKDDQYLNSNHDILQQNKKLNDQIATMSRIMEQQTEKIQSQTASHSFFRKKCDQLEITVLETRKKLISTEQQVAKHKQCLNQIQASLKQVENMSQLNSQRMIGLQQENKGINSEASQLRVKTKALTTQIQLKDQNYNKLQYAWEELKKKSQKLQKIKDDLELQNSNLRLKNLEISEEYRVNVQKIKKIQYENGVLIKQNKKCMQQINELTKRLISYVGEKQFVSKKKQEIRSEVADQINEQLKSLKNQYYETKILVKDYLEQTQVSIKQQSDQIVNQIISYTNSLPHKNIKQQYQSQRSAVSNVVIPKSLMRLGGIKQDINNIKEYCEYVKKQFLGQIGFVKNLIKLPNNILEAQSERLSEDCNILLKVNLMVNSLRNQKEAIIQTISSDKIAFKLFLSSFERQLCEKIEQFLSNASRTCSICRANSKQMVDLSKQSVADEEQEKAESQPEREKEDEKSKKSLDELNKYLINKSVQKHHFESEQEYMSPQFVKIRKGTSDSKSNHNYQIEQFNQQENKQRFIKTQRNYQDNNCKRQSQFMEREEESLGKIRGSGALIENEEAQRVRRILLSLKQVEQQPRVPYFQLIKKQYRQIKRRLMRNLNLDISGVSFKPMTNISSPSSVSFTKDFIFDKKFNTEPNEQLLRLSNRDEYKHDDTVGGLKKYNEQLKEYIQKLEEEIKVLEYKQQSTKITINELEKKLVELENSSSQQMKQKLFLKFLNDLNNQNWEQAEICCRTFLKLLKLSNAELDEKMDKFKFFVAKHTKKNNHGLLSGLFNKNSKN